MQGARQQRAEAVAEVRVGADRHRLEAGAMEGAVVGERLPAAGVEFGEHHGHLDRLGAAGAHEHPSEAGRRDRHELLRQADGREVGEPPRREQQPVAEAALDRSHHRGMVVADGVHAVAVQVEVRPAGCVVDPAALGPDDGVGDRRGERLMEKHGGVPLHQVTGRGVEFGGGRGRQPATLSLVHGGGAARPARRRHEPSSAARRSTYQRRKASTLYSFCGESGPGR